MNSSNASLYDKHPPPRASWRLLFRENTTEATTRCSLSTLSTDPDTGEIYPRVRTCVFRGFWSELELRKQSRLAIQEQFESKKKKAKDSGGPERGLSTFASDSDPNYNGDTESDDFFGNYSKDPVNEAVFESDMLTFTTDARTEKVTQIIKGDDRSKGNTELLFWFPQPGIQWRIKGKAFIVGGPPTNDAEQLARQEIKKGMRQCRGYSNKTARKWSWDKEITAHFANLRPYMRGTFTNPPPGTSKPIGLNISTTYIHDLSDPEARKNFRIVVIRPDEVEMLDLAAEPNTRTTWKLQDKDDGSGTEWKEQEIWP